MTLVKSFDFLKGLTIKEAQTKMEDIPHFRLMYIRVTRNNNIPMICTMDYVKDRLNVHIVDNKITDIIGVG